MTPRHPVLRAGDSLRVAGQTHILASIDGVSIRLVDVPGATSEITIGELLADPSLELASSSRVPSTPQATLERLPAEAVETTRWWEHHVLEVLTGTPPDAPAGSAPRRSTTRGGARCGNGSWPRSTISPSRAMSSRAAVCSGSDSATRTRACSAWSTGAPRDVRGPAVGSIHGSSTPPDRPSPRRPTAPPARCSDCVGEWSSCSPSNPSCRRCPAPAPSTG